jgi:hypothetical protein
MATLYHTPMVLALRCCLQRQNMSSLCLGRVMILRIVLRKEFWLAGSGASVALALPMKMRPGAVPDLSLLF